MSVWRNMPQRSLVGLSSVYNHVYDDILYNIHWWPFSEVLPLSASIYFEGQGTYYTLTILAGSLLLLSYIIVTLV